MVNKYLKPGTIPCVNLYRSPTTALPWGGTIPGVASLRLASTYLALFAWRQLTLLFLRWIPAVLRLSLAGTVAPTNPGWHRAAPHPPGLAPCRPSSTRAGTVLPLVHPG